MKRKVLTFVTDGKKFLTLFSEPHPEHGKGGWFTVTGGVEGSESLIEAVIREVREETNLNVKETFDLNWGSVYKWSGEECQESNHLAFVEKGKVLLNEEHTKFKWLELDDYVNTLAWGDDKEILRKVLKEALKKKLHFKETSLIDFRKKKQGRKVYITK